MNKSRDINQSYRLELSRRRFLKIVPFAALSCIVPRPALAARFGGLSQKRTLSFYNIHTKESLHEVYWVNGTYRSDALRRINYILRDHRTAKIETIDTRLLDLLQGINTQIAAKEPFHVISGYRSPETNALLRKRSGAVARQSYHTLGKAVDISVPGYSLSRLKDVAQNLKQGGVGYYPNNDFIHVDVGPVRYW